MQLTPTPNVYYAKGFKYRLTRRLVLQSSVFPPEDIITPDFEIHTDGILIGHPGWSYDGPSGPTWDSPCSMRAAGGHDIPYEAMRKGLLDWSFKQAIDDDFYGWLLEDGMWVWRAKAWHKAVTECGGGEKVDPYKEFSAPDPKAVSKPDHFKK